jgi:acyl-CoA synthetase (AMP-forming)/AMP-acid ligase II
LYSFHFRVNASQVLLLSARLSPTAIHHLLKNAAATAIIASPRLQNIAREGLSLFTPEDVSPVLYVQKPYESFLGGTDANASICAPWHYVGESDRDVLILHSSGTTGLPKPIYTSHTYLLGFTACHNFANNEQAQGLNVSLLPLYHVR